jgi:diguanylate cyclase (GGDEF)-like protein
MLAKLRFRRHRERLYTWLIVLIGIGLAVAAAWFAGDYSSRLADEGFKREVTSRNAALDASIARHEQMVRALAAFVATRDAVNPADFKAFVDTMKGGASGMQAMQWMPLVKGAERAAFEEGGRLDYPEFHITEQIGQWEITSAAAREEYLPVRLIEPLEGNRPALGFDLLSDLLHADAVRRAGNGDALIATERLVLLQEEGVQYGVMLLAPVRGRDGTLRGYVAGVFRIGDLLESSLAGLPPVGLHISVTDATGPSSERALHVFSDRLNDVRDLMAIPVQSSEEGLANELLATHELEVGDRLWRVYYQPGPGYYAPLPPVPTWVAAVVVLLMTAMLTALLLLMQKRAQLLARASLADGLTGLANRAFCDRMLAAEWDRSVRYGKPISIVLVDVDQFAGYNAALGPLAGDDCLRRLALTLANVPGRSSDLVCRYAGDRFIVVLPETRFEGAHELATRVTQAVRALEIPFPGRKPAPIVTVTTVVAAATPQRGDSLPAFVSRALDMLDTADRRDGDTVLGLSVAGS